VITSGEGAIAHAMEDHPDLILMDVKLNGELDGIDSAHEIRKHLDIPVVFMTAYTDEDTFERAKETDPAGYILKPFENRDLRSTIEMALYKHEMEQKLKQSEAKYRRLFEQSAAMLADTEALYFLSLALTTAETLSDLLDEAVTNVVRTLPADRAALITVDVEKKQITNVAVNNCPERFKAFTSFEKLKGTLCGWVIENKKPACYRKNEAFPNELSAMEQRRQRYNFGAILAVPLIYRGRILGTMTATNSSNGPNFTQRDVKLLSAMAGQIAVALENARLLQMLKQRVAELEAIRLATLSLTSSLKLQKVLEGILQSAVILLPGVVKSIIYLYRNEQLDFAAEIVVDTSYENPEISAPRPEGATYTAARSGEMVVISDTRVHPKFTAAHEYWKIAMISLPLKINRQVVGVMNLFQPAPYPWSAAELRVLGMLGDHAAIATENARLYEQMNSA
jgi:GAF domain-containing protein